MTSKHEMKNARGKLTRVTSLLQRTPPVVVLGHPFGKTLEQWRTGVPMDFGAAWSLEAIHNAIDRGPTEDRT
jgi:hypothetical protein